MSRVLITVVGPRRRASLAVPFERPIQDLIGGLVVRCGENGDPSNDDPALRWAITRTDARVLPSDRSLQDCGITDGAVLYLRAVNGDDAAATRVDPAATRADAGAALPERLRLRERLRRCAGAVLAPGSPASREVPRAGGDGPAPPESLTLHSTPSPLVRWTAAWRESDYLTRLDAMIAAPRLRRCVTVAVMSPKGGVGKTTITALLGTLLANIRRDRVVAVDTNPDFGSLGRSLTPEHATYVDDLLYMFENPAITVTALDASLGRGPHGLMVLPAPTDPARMAHLDEEAYTRVIRRLQDLVGVVVLDCGTGLQEPAARAASACADAIVLVSDAEPATASIVAEAAGLLTHSSSRLTLVVNKMPERRSRLDLDALARCMPHARATVIVPADTTTAARVGAGDFHWSRAPRGWQRSGRELAATVMADCRDMGLAT